MIKLYISKIYRTQILLKALSCLCFSIPIILQSQDSITVEVLQKYSYTFDIKNHEFHGEGATIIHDAIANAQITMLGNNSRNKQEELLDLALIKILDENGYHNMIMELGPASGSIINNLSNEPSETVERLKKLNQEYFFETETTQLMPVPDLKYLGTAEMIQSIKEQSWTLSGIGTDSWTSYRMLIDEMYHKLPDDQQKLLKRKYQSSILLIDQLYKEMEGQSSNEILQLTNGIKSSDDITSFLHQASKFGINKMLVESFQFSLDYWHMYGKKEFYKKNKLDAQRNKQLLRAYVAQQSFDLSQDKLFVKMWRGHLTNGLTSRGFYGIGNTLMELASYHGNTSLSIGVLGRYQIKDGVTTDILDDGGFISPLHRSFISLGQKDQWVLIDLRAFTKAFYYGNYHTPLELQMMMGRFDMILIPKTDSKATINY